MKTIQIELWGPSKCVCMVKLMVSLYPRNNLKVLTIILKINYGLCSGYMAPEYAMHGQFSAKSDTFSFGVLVLEIVSGKKNSCFRHGENIEDLLSYVSIIILGPKKTLSSR